MESGYIGIVAGRNVAGIGGRETGRAAEIELREDRRIVDGISAANHQLSIAERIPGEAESRREIGVDVWTERARLAIEARVHSAAEQAGDRILRVRIEIADAIVALERLLHEIVAESEIQREAARYFPVVLNEGAGRVAYLGLAQHSIEGGAGYRAEHEGSKSRAGAGRLLRIRREVGIERERARWLTTLAIVPSQQPMLHARLHGVAASDLGYDVCEIPIERAARAYSSVADRRVAEVHDRKQIRRDAGGESQLLRPVLAEAGGDKGEVLAREADTQIVD